MSRLDNFLNEDKYTDYSDHNKNLVVKEMEIWHGSMKFATDQLKQGNYDNALRSLDTQKRIAGRLHTAVKNLKKDSESKGVTKKRTYQF